MIFYGSWDGTDYALDSTHVAAVGRLTDAGDERPLMTLGQLFELPDKQLASSAPMATLRSREGLWDLAFERISRPASVFESDILPFPEELIGAGGTAFRAIVRREGQRPALWLDPGVFFPCNDIGPKVRNIAPEPIGGSASNRLLLVPAAPDAAGRPVSLGLPLALVAEALDSAAFVAVPACPDNYLGLILWRERAVPVFDLFGWLGLAPTVQADRMLVVRRRSGGRPIAVPVGGRPRVLRLPVAHVKSDRDLGLIPERAECAIELADETVILANLA